MSCEQKVIVIVSDGKHRPEPNALDYQGMLARVRKFRDAGGIVICVGVRADSDGYALLQQLATPGYFINVHGNGTGVVATAATKLLGLLAYVCGGGSVPQPIGQQIQDQNPLPEVEGSIQDCPAAEALPKLPDVAFSIASGTSIGTGLSLLLSVPFHADAEIRYTTTIDGTEPPDPVFGPLSSNSTGLDYDGAGAPVTIDPLVGNNFRIKAIARKAGYSNSDVAASSYTGS